jgi:hypothetical protein
MRISVPLTRGPPRQVWYKEEVVLRGTTDRYTDRQCALVIEDFLRDVSLERIRELCHYRGKWVSGRNRGGCSH